MHLVSHIQNPHLRGEPQLHVIGVVSNVERYNSRYRLTRQWIAQMLETPHVKLHMVEVAFGDRHHEIVDDAYLAAGHSGLQLRTNTNAWTKECTINLAERRLVPADAKYICTSDCDIEFRNPNWALETMHQLQHFHVVQPWSHCLDLGFRGNVIGTHASFGYTDCTGTRATSHGPGGYTYGHTGYCWAYTRAFWEQVGGLVDFCILGSADHHMALACVGETEKTIHTKMIHPFRRRLLEWQERAVKLSHYQVGCVDGRIEHHWHGSKKRRFYKERWQILVDHGFDPDTDLMKDEQGLIYIVGKPGLEADIRKYNRSRQEDSIDA